MRTKTKNIMIAFSVFFLFLTIGMKQAQAQRASVSFQIFYDQLAPYGEWVNDPDYGYIWLPEVSQDFQPYATNGYWVNTQYGNTWYSNYDWGWAPFHYGRWVYTDYYGWAWVPGYEWGPAWVSWRQGGGQYGWAPLGPGMSFSLNINIPLRNWVFVPQRYLFNNNIYRYYTPHRNYSNFYNRTTIINNVYVYNNHNYYSGPDRRSLERATRNRVAVHEVRNNTRPGRSTISNNSVGIYRPNISAESNRNARPARVVSPDKVTARPSQVTSNRNSNNANSVNSRPTTRSATNRVEPGASTTNREARGDNGQTVRGNNETSSSGNRPSRTSTVPTRRESTAPATTNNTNPTTNGRVTRQSRSDNSKITPNSNQRNQEVRQSRTPAQRETVPAERESRPTQRTTEPTRRENAPMQRTAPTQQREVRSPQRETRPTVSNTRNGNNNRASESKTTTRNSKQDQRSSRRSDR